VSRMGQETELPNTEEDSTKTVPEEIPEKKESDIDELSERLRTSPDAEEDIGEWLVANWQKLLGGLAVVLVAVYLVGKWQEVHATKLGEAAQGFARIQEAFTNAGNSEVVGPEVQGKGSEEEKTKDPENESDPALKVQARFEENLELLRSSYSDTTYGKLAPLYQAAEEIRGKDYSKAKEILIKAGALRFVAEESRNGSLTKEKLASELASLLYARLLIEEGKTEKEQIRGHLESLIQKANFVNIEALIVLLRFDDEPKAQERALEQVDKLKASRPDLGETLRVELGNLGVIVE